MQHQSKQFGELLATAKGFTLKTNFRDAMDGYCFGSTETKKNDGAKVKFGRRSNFKALSADRRENMSPLSRDRRQTAPKFS